MQTQKQKSQHSQPQPQSQPKPPHYTLILRLPFPRPEGFPQNEQSSQHHKPLEPHHHPELLQHHQQPQHTPSPRDSNLYNNNDPQTPPRHASASTATYTAPTAVLSPESAAVGGTPQNVTAGTSEGTPSMGSSFSDLSVAQSALEEALMSADGGFGSRVSTLGGR
jgi:hypothetical protein